MSNFNELIKKVQEKYPDIQKYVGKSKNEKTLRYKSSKLKNYFYISEVIANNQEKKVPDEGKIKNPLWVINPSIL